MLSDSALGSPSSNKKDIGEKKRCPPFKNALRPPRNFLLTTKATLGTKSGFFGDDPQRGPSRPTPGCPKENWGGDPTRMTISGFLEMQRGET
ncbi:hypothetical protein TNIN_458801 [Trichonephila inaurata madagascariensis]|uniref:Uncharacterized protein n=1 Tax=Trichonephila inaurata madagascariensis TaxID=2747483 RepID=A0A8X7C6M3_9ARAC|nr:hypothetical protein TNIN_458801 [Trichonephila inaurata madagascariensis]